MLAPYALTNPYKRDGMPLRGIDGLFDIGRTCDAAVGRGFIFRRVTDTLIRRRRLFSCRGNLGNWHNRRLLPDEPNRSTRGPKREKRNVRESENHEQNCEELTFDQRKRLPSRWCEGVLKPVRRTVTSELSTHLSQRFPGV